MKTVFFLMAQYESAIVPIDRVATDYFKMTTDKLLRKITSGEIPLPLVRLGTTQKSARGVHLTDLAAYIDKQAEAARRECEQLKP